MIGIDKMIGAIEVDNTDREGRDRDRDRDRDGDGK
jgi:hypothetical protein